MYRTDNFTLIPDIAPIVSGHLLLIPNDHVESAHLIDDRLKLELNSLRSLVGDFFLSSFDSACLEFEHGAVGLRNCGGCINHCHIHLLPFKVSDWVKLVQITDRATRGHTEKAKVINGEYLTAKFGGERYYWSSKSQQSQFFRRAISEINETPYKSNWLDSIDGRNHIIADSDLEQVINKWAAFLGQKGQYSRIE